MEKITKNSDLSKYENALIINKKGERAIIKKGAFVPEKKSFNTEGRFIVLGYTYERTNQ